MFFCFRKLSLLHGLLTVASSVKGKKRKNFDYRNGKSSTENDVVFCVLLPIGSMYGIFTYIWLIFMVNVGIYTIHGSYGLVGDLTPDPLRISWDPSKGAGGVEGLTNCFFASGFLGTLQFPPVT